MMYRYKRHLEPWRGRIRSLQCACSGCEPPPSQGSSRDCAAWAEWTSVSAWGAALAALTNSRWIEPCGAARVAKPANACSAHMCRCFRGWRAINWQHSLRCRRHSCVCASQLLHVCPQRACTAHPRSVRAHSFSMVPMARRGGWGGEGGGDGAAEGRGRSHEPGPTRGCRVPQQRLLGVLAARTRAPCRVPWRQLRRSLLSPPWGRSRWQLRQCEGLRERTRAGSGGMGSSRRQQKRKTTCPSLRNKTERCFGTAKTQAACPI